MLPCILHTVHCTLHTAHCILQIAHYTPHYTLHTLLLTMRCMRCTAIQHAAVHEHWASWLWRGANGHILYLLWGVSSVWCLLHFCNASTHIVSFLCHQLRIICCHTCIVIPCLCHIFPGSVNYSTTHTYCVLIEVYVVLLFCQFFIFFKSIYNVIMWQKKTFVESSSKESHHLERFSLKCFKSAISDFCLQIFQIKYLT